LKLGAADMGAGVLARLPPIADARLQCGISCPKVRIVRSEDGMVVPEEKVSKMLVHGQVTSRATPGGIMGCRIRDISNKINASFAGHEHLRELHHISSGFRILTDWRPKIF
jgi:hypothetical protein